MTKEEKQQYQLNYRKINREKIKLQRAEWRINNKHIIHERSSAYQKKYQKKLNIKSNNQRFLYLREWSVCVPSMTKCEICGKDITLNSGNQRNSIHFDHKTPSNIIPSKPTVWLAQHRYSKDRELLWKSCNFGCLCYRCNKFLPTENRKEWFRLAYKYIFEREMPL